MQELNCELLSWAIVEGIVNDNAPTIYSAACLIMNMNASHYMIQQF